MDRLEKHGTEALNQFRRACRNSTGRFAKEKRKCQRLCGVQSVPRLISSVALVRCQAKRERVLQPCRQPHFLECLIAEESTVNRCGVHTASQCGGLRVPEEIEAKLRVHTMTVGIGTGLKGHSEVYEDRSRAAAVDDIYG